MSGERAASGRATRPARSGDLRESPGGARETVLVVVPPRDDRMLAAFSYPSRPEHGSPANAAKIAVRPDPGPPAGLVIDFGQRRVLLDGREIELVFQEFELLEFLAAHPYRAFTREQLLGSAWASQQQGTSRTVDVHIHRLRRKLGPAWAHHLVTVRRVGYMFRPPRLDVSP
jgi:Transcriptional regulatory protein, C terminal